MEDTRIEYADHTFSPWIGCGHGCSYCYAKRWAARFPLYKDCFSPYGNRVRTSVQSWNKLRKWNAQATKTGSRAVILPSLCDPFELRDDLIEPRHDFFKAIEGTPNLQYLLLTKRPENINYTFFCDPRIHLTENIWLGTSVESQTAADARIPELLDVATPRRFLSLEPLLGPVNLKPYLHGIHWVIAGGQTGPEAQPLHPAWIRSIRDQCKRAGVPFFFKQWGEWWSSNQSECRAFLLFQPAKEKIPTRIFNPENPMYEGQTFYRVGKKNSGRTLDRKLHLELPHNLYN